MRRIAGVLLLLVLAACPAPKRPARWQPGDPTKLVASLRRTGCYGICPSYEVYVYADGRVEWVGINWVETLGRAQKRLDSTAMNALVDAFDDAHFRSLADAYEKADKTDLPSATLTYEFLGPRKIVRHYHGDDSAPPALTALEDRFDELTGTAAWIGHARPAERH